MTNPPNFLNTSQNSAQNSLLRILTADIMIYIDKLTTWRDYSYILIHYNNNIGNCDIIVELMSKKSTKKED